MDIRLYYYSNGQLMKYSSLKGQHKFISIESAKGFASRINLKKQIPNQWVIVEYSGVYNSRIIEVV